MGWCKVLVENIALLSSSPLTQTPGKTSLFIAVPGRNSFQILLVFFFSVFTGESEALISDS